ncbi:hypothetical protein BN2476_710031 [Paraburkholderia piptadeniae]|uniref:Uncharacterized protein n=1 Tax=Paraburkholderia piptadeniae TaxID=1701573 RepID=A0A1N7SR11_9BURK|nr:hypothetical protein [Paraburkholderia piptadeniae]SIT49785.1 hypothetical protein BN2476_710031 [Paraburkholderia piptadeniae]
MPSIKTQTPHAMLEDVAPESRPRSATDEHRLVLAHAMQQLPMMPRIAAWFAARRDRKKSPYGITLNLHREKKVRNIATRDAYCSREAHVRY